MSQKKEENIVPPEVETLIADVIESSGTPPKAQKAVEEIEEELENRADKYLEKAKNIPVAKVALNGIFRHPPEFTEEEWDIIIAGLKAHLPLSAIAMRVHCERHFLAKKIQENEEVAQLVIDAREGIIDETEHQLYKVAKTGSIAAIIYLLDHLGKQRGYGDQGAAQIGMDDVNISFGEISQKDIEDGQKQIEEANKITTPTLAAELLAHEIPQPSIAHGLAVVEEMAKAVDKATQPPPPAEMPPENVSPPPYSSSSQVNYDFLDNAFSEGADSPFANF